jgi:hypothetical protein
MQCLVEHTRADSFDASTSLSVELSYDTTVAVQQNRDPPRV